jgi:hypothetical protein
MGCAAHPGGYLVEFGPTDFCGEKVSNGKGNLEWPDGGRKR